MPPASFCTASTGTVTFQFFISFIHLDQQVCQDAPLPQELTYCLGRETQVFFPSSQVLFRNWASDVQGIFVGSDILASLQEVAQADEGARKVDCRAEWNKMTCIFI